MNSKIVFDSHVPVKSILHRLDPRIKLVMCIIYIILIFFVNNSLAAIWLLLVLLAAIKLSDAGLRQYWQGIKPLFLIIPITVAFQILFNSGGKTYWHWGTMAITRDGLINSLIIFYQSIVIITASTALTATTQTFQIANALAWLVKPLQAIKVSVNQITLMLSIALRFVPAIMDETNKIMKAQRARGINFNAGDLLTRIKHLAPILIPLFVNSFKRAEELVTAMEAREYGPDTPRTHYHQLVWHKNDAWADLALLIVTVGLVCIRIFF